MQLPQFRLSPNAYSIGVFVEEDGICSCCQQPRSIRYSSSFYSKNRPTYICPWCIHSGAAAQMFSGEFNDYCGIEGISPDPSYPSQFNISADLIEEVCTRTPSYNSWQQEAWLVHCSQPCSFLGYADYQQIAHLLPELESDIAHIPESHIRAMTKEASFSGYLFKCTQCGLHRLHTDCS